MNIRSTLNQGRHNLLLQPSSLSLTCIPIMLVTLYARPSSQIRYILLRNWQVGQLIIQPDVRQQVVA
jgi:hypothetical protein